MEAFEEYAAKILAKLYENFPRKTVIDFLALSGGGEIDEYGNLPPEAELVKETAEWLAREGYIEIESRLECGFGGARLTALGLAALNAVPKSLSGKTPLGKRIVTAVKGGAKETACTLVRVFTAEAVKMLLGG